MTINHADTAKDPRIIQELAKDSKALTTDPNYKSAPALSFRDGRVIWFRTFNLAKGARAIAASIIHEGSHLVGAPTDFLAEMALDAIHNASNLPR
jgi:hypothetical protein